MSLPNLENIPTNFCKIFLFLFIFKFPTTVPVTFPGKAGAAGGLTAPFILLFAGPVGGTRCVPGVGAGGFLVGTVSIGVGTVCFLVGVGSVGPVGSVGLGVGSVGFLVGVGSVGSGGFLVGLGVGFMVGVGSVGPSVGSVACGLL